MKLNNAVKTNPTEAALGQSGSIFLATDETRMKHGWNQWQPRRFHYPCSIRVSSVANKAFTLVELLVVIAIIGLLAALIVGAAGRAGVARVKSRVKTDMGAIETAIVAYHSKMSVYPPDGTNDVRVAPLFYELTGTKFNDTDKVYESMFIPGTEGKVTPNDAYTAFGRRGFANSHPDDARNFFPTLKAGAYRPVVKNGAKVQVLVVPVAGPNDFASADGDAKTVNTWRYVSKNPTHNPGSYDLWAEVLIGGKTNIIGNWKE